jgi:hypothetical protein
MTGALWDLYPVLASLRRSSAGGAGVGWKSTLLGRLTSHVD